MTLTCDISLKKSNWSASLSMKSSSNSTCSQRPCVAYLCSLSTRVPSTVGDTSVTADSLSVLLNVKCRPCFSLPLKELRRQVIYSYILTHAFNYNYIIPYVWIYQTKLTWSKMLNIVLLCTYKAMQNNKCEYWSRVIWIYMYNYVLLCMTVIHNTHCMKNKIQSR